MTKFIVLVALLIAAVVATPQSGFQQVRQIVPAPENFAPNAKQSAGHEEAKDLQGAASYGHGSYGLYSPYTTYSLGYYGGYPYHGGYHGGYGYASPYYYKGYSGLYGGYWY